MYTFTESRKRETHICLSNFCVERQKLVSIVVALIFDLIPIRPYIDPVNLCASFTLCFSHRPVCERRQNTNSSIDRLVSLLNETHWAGHYLMVYFCF